MTSRAESRSRSPSRPPPEWNEELWKFFTEEVMVEAPETIIQETIEMLETAGEITQRWELLAAPEEIML